MVLDGGCHVAERGVHLFGDTLWLNLPLDGCCRVINEDCLTEAYALICGFFFFRPNGFLVENLCGLWKCPEAGSSRRHIRPEDEPGRRVGQIYAHALLCGFLPLLPNAIEPLEVRAALRGARLS